MNKRTHEKLRALNGFLWASYASLITPGETAKLAVFVEARTEEDAALTAQVLKRMECEDVEVSARGSFRRRWRIGAVTAPLQVGETTIDEWQRALLGSLEGTSAELVHWVPLDAGA